MWMLKTKDRLQFLLTYNYINLKKEMYVHVWAGNSKQTQ